MLCGHLWFDDRTANPLIAMLPPVLHFRAAYDGRPDGWLEPMLQFVAWEHQAQAPGADAILARLGDVIVIQAIRAHLAQLTDGGSGWLHALAEPQLGQALGLIHQHPETPWTVPRLAAHVGLSRSKFSEHFTDLVGEPPQRYTTAGACTTPDASYARPTRPSPPSPGGWDTRPSPHSAAPSPAGSGSHPAPSNATTPNTSGRRHPCATPQAPSRIERQRPCRTHMTHPGRRLRYACASRSWRASDSPWQARPWNG